MQSRTLKNLPPSSDEFWQEAEKYAHEPRDMGVCKTHSRHNWREHDGYNDNHDGTLSCKYCSWGGIMGNRYRVQDGRIVELTSLNRQ